MRFLWFTLKKKKICGVGINDADYAIQPKCGALQIKCKVYAVWKNMITRCYDMKRIMKFPTYAGCSVCEEWLTFSNFKSWMETQNWQGKYLDKDILVKGNKVYSPETCVFVCSVVNNFILDSAATRGKFKIGVNLEFRVGKFRSQCGNPITNQREFLGYFTCQDQAHEAWRKRKHELACQLADMQDDPRVAKALRTRYLPPN